MARRLLERCAVKPRLAVATCALLITMAGCAAGSGASSPGGGGNTSGGAGTGFGPASIVDLTGSASFDSVDFDHALRVVVSNDIAFGQAQIAQLQFVDCNAAPVPVPGDFVPCNVTGAFGAGGVTFANGSSGLLIKSSLPAGTMLITMRAVER